MLLKKLELENFRQYAGKQTVEFSTDPDKNVTLFLGRNTSGKTTLIQAFRWVFFEDSDFTGKGNTSDILNRDVRSSMRAGDTQVAKVTLTFTHQGIEYEVSRRYEYRSKISGDAYLDKKYPAILYYYPNGERECVTNGDTKLSEIMPESLAEYFFFDGEKISQSRKPEKVKNSINTIMGLVPLEHMMGHLRDNRRNNVSDTLRSQLKDDSGVRVINSKITRANENLGIAEDAEEQAHKRFIESESRTENLRVEMEQIKDVAKSAEELKIVETKQDEMKESIKRTEDDIIATFIPAMYEAMVAYVAGDISEKLSSAEYDDKGIPGMNATAIHHILDSGKCICGTCLDGNEKCRETLSSLLTYLPPESVGTQIAHLRKLLGDMAVSKDKQQLFGYHCGNYIDKLNEMDSLEDRCNILSEKVQQNRDADVILRDYNAAKKAKENFHKDEVRYSGEIARIKREIQAYDAELRSAASVDSYNSEITTKLAYVKALYDMASNEYDRNEGGIFEEIQKTLTDVFNSMYHGKRTIELTTDYKVRLTVGGENLDNSKGLDTVQNFAFIASLLKVAKDRAGLQLNSEPYPLAMDAVFSDTDEHHIQNICKELPKLAEQSILAIMDKDWSVASSALEPYVGKKYRIEKLSETHSEICEITEGE